MRFLKGPMFIFGWIIFLAFFVGATPLSSLAEEGETISGVVKTPWVKRYQALVYIERVDGKEFPPPKENAFMGQSGLVFNPHVLHIIKGTTVDFTNNDSVVHNVFSPDGSAKRFNLGTYGAGVNKAVTFDDLGEVTLLCNVHPEMSAYIIVLQNPYAALTDKRGNFEIKAVPPGQYRLKVWHQKLKEVSQEVVVESGKTVTVEFAKKLFKKR